MFSLGFDLSLLQGKRLIFLLLRFCFTKIGQLYNCYIMVQSPSPKSLVVPKEKTNNNQGSNCSPISEDGVIHLLFVAQVILEIQCTVGQLCNFMSCLLVEWEHEGKISPKIIKQLLVSQVKYFAIDVLACLKARICRMLEK